ncbi:MAG: TraY domain-containing protein [Micrococcales bacterium]|nr:TraY domain-containing protein [Micrococcales bacterium]
MAMNLRLDPSLEEALGREAARSGRSKTAIISQALTDALDKADPDHPAEQQPLVPYAPYRMVYPRLELPEGVTSADLINEQREERLW